MSDYRRLVRAVKKHGAVYTHQEKGWEVTILFYTVNGEVLEISENFVIWRRDGWLHRRSTDRCGRLLKVMARQQYRDFKIKGF